MIMSYADILNSVQLLKNY